MGLRNRRPKSVGLILAFQQQHSSACSIQLWEGGQIFWAGTGLPGTDTQDRAWREEMVTQTLRRSRAETLSENCRWHQKLCALCSLIPQGVHHCVAHCCQHYVASPTVCFSTQVWQHSNTIPEKRPQSRHQLLHVVPVCNTIVHVFLTEYLKHRKKNSPYWNKLLQGVWRNHSAEQTNWSIQLLPAGGNSVQIFTRQNTLTGSCRVLLLTITWNRCHLLLHIIKIVIELP